MSLNLTFSQFLTYVGKLDDAEGNGTPRERLRDFLQNNVCEVGQIRDCIEECLKNSGDQYNRALQDLVNHLGGFLGFEVIFGRYQGVSGKNGFDGHWKSPKGLHIIIEVKTTDAYTIQSSTLIGYVDKLISDQKIPNWEQALGLYVVGRPDAGLRQLENAIVVERRTHQLRIISTESLLSLAEMMKNHDVTHQEVLSLLLPSSPKIDPIVGLMTRLLAKWGEERRPSAIALPQIPIVEENPDALAEAFIKTGSSINISPSLPIFCLRLPGESVCAKARVDINGRFIVLKDSFVRKDYQPSCPKNAIEYREWLCQEGKLRSAREGSSLLFFTEDVSFDKLKPSTIASIIVGTAVDGLRAWKMEGSGQTYGEWKVRESPL